MGNENGLAESARQPRSLSERLAAEARAAEAEVPAPSSMAERFAPEPQPSASTSGPRARGPVPPLRAPASSRISAPTRARTPLASPLLLGFLAVVAVIPSLVLAALYWGETVAVPHWLPMPAALAGNEAPPPLQEAVMANAASTETVLAKRNIELPAVALSLASDIQAEAGKRVQFPIALDSGDRLPLRSIISVRGLPAGATFSAGRPYGETEWSLRPDEIGDLSLALPQAAQGKHVVGVVLIAGDGTAIASGTTRLDIAADPKAALILRPGDAARVEELLAHGQKMIEVGYLAGARGYFKRAAEAGSAEAALALGATFDPSFIAEIEAQGIPPDPAEARLWYERAKMLGSSLADDRIAALDRPPLPQQEGGSLQPVAQKTAPEPVDETEWVEVSGSVNVRAGPAPEGKIITVAERGSRYKVTGRKGGWVQVTDPKTSKVGWVYSRFVVASGAP